MAFFQLLLLKKILEDFGVYTLDSSNAISRSKGRLCVNVK